MRKRRETEREKRNMAMLLMEGFKADKREVLFEERFRREREREMILRTARPKHRRL